MRNLLARLGARLRTVPARLGRLNPGQGAAGVVLISAGTYGLFGWPIAAIVLGCFLVLAAALESR